MAKKRKKQHPAQKSADNNARLHAARTSALMVLPRLCAHQMPALMTGLEVVAGLPMWDLIDHARKHCYSALTPDNLDVERFLHGDSPQPAPRSEDERTTRLCYNSFGATQAAVSRGRHAYFVSPDMSALVVAGSERSADVPVTVADLPSPYGIAFFQTPDEAFFLLWATIQRVVHLQMVTRKGMRYFLEQDGTAGFTAGTIRYLPLPLTEIVLSASDTDIAPDPASIRIDNFYTPNADDSEALKHVHALGARGDAVAATFLSFVNMVRQEKLAGAVERMHRTKLFGNTKLTSSPVTYIYYRRTESSTDSTTSSRGDRSVNRHPVRGHWKRQWYPSQQRHHPIFIVEYLRGAGDGDPITVRDKINML